MKVGIYLNIPDPTSGGAGSLLSTINEEIKSSNDNIHDFVFIYDGKKTDGYCKWTSKRICIPQLSEMPR